MRYVCVFVLAATGLAAQDGESIYKQRCAICHDAPAAHVPAISAIKAMSGEAIYTTLTRGVMKTQAEGLSSAQLMALIGYIAPTGGSHAAAPDLTRTCKSDATFSVGAKMPQWNGWSSSATNSRFQDASSAGLTAGDVGKLKLKWAFHLGDVTEARSQPTVMGQRVFIATSMGAVYSLDEDSGCTRWGYLAEKPIRGGVTLGMANGTPAVFLADSGGTLYALNAGQAR